MSATVREMTVSDVVDNQPMSRFQIGIIVMCGFIAVLDGFDTQSIGFLATSRYLRHDLDTPPLFYNGEFGPLMQDRLCGAGLRGGMRGREWS